jgi:hypothetical protein
VATRTETATVAVPAGTAITAPQVTALSLRDSIMERIEVRVPPGPSGLVGFAFVHSGQQVIPYTDGQWIVTDNESLVWPVEDYPTGDKWSVKAYNLDVYPHTLYCRFHLREIGQASNAIRPQVVIGAQGSAVTGG